MSGAAHACGLPAAGVAALVAAIGLDQVAFGQFMISQPLVGGWLLGWACGDPGAGLLAGAFFQVLCLTDLPLGASVPPDTTFAGLVGAAAFLLLPRPAGWSDPALLGLLCVGFLPVAHLARAADLGARRANRHWVALAEAMVRRGRARLAQAATLGGLLSFSARGLVVALVVLLPLAAWGGRGLERVAAAEPVLALFGRLVPLLGLAALVARRRRPRWPAALAAGIGAGVLAGRMLP